jgi:hypothetical protein
MRALRLICAANVYEKECIKGHEKRIFTRYWVEQYAIAGFRTENRAAPDEKDCAPQCGPPQKIHIRNADQVIMVHRYERKARINNIESAQMMNRMWQTVKKP